MESIILLSRPAEHIVQVALNTPRQLNALSRQMIRELSETIDQFENSADHVLILTASGRAFCFGADFREFEDRSALPDMLRMFQKLIDKLYNCSKITIASLNGFATGAGLDLALSCDFRIAAEKIKMGEAYINMGLVPDGGGSYVLPRLVGVSRALEMFLTGEAITAEQAHQMGIVHRIYPPLELQSNVLAFAITLAAKPQTALRLTKKLIKSNVADDFKAALGREHAAQIECFADPQHLSLVEDFLQKRKKER